MILPIISISISFHRIVSYRKVFFSYFSFPIYCIVVIADIFSSSMMYYRLVRMILFIFHVFSCLFTSFHVDSFLCFFMSLHVFSSFLMSIHVFSSFCMPFMSFISSHVSSHLILSWHKVHDLWLHDLSLSLMKISIVQTSVLNTHEGAESYDGRLWLQQLPRTSYSFLWLSAGFFNFTEKERVMNLVAVTHKNLPVKQGSGGCTIMRDCVNSFE